MKAKKNKLALFMPSKTSFYEGLFLSLKQAFEQYGYEVCGGTTFLVDEELSLFIEEHKPSAFFEMNRCKSEIKNFPEAIFHACWLVDLWGRALSDIQGSEVVYFISIEWMRDAVKSPKSKYAWLPPAADPKDYYPIKSTIKVFKSVFLGHIPHPWTEKLQQRIIAQDNNNKILFSDVLDVFEEKWGNQDGIYNNDVYINDIYEWLKEKNIKDINIIDTTLRYDLGCRIIRKARRSHFLDYLLKNENIEPFAIFGNENWKEWKKYIGYYHKELSSTSEMNEVYNQAKLLIHEGIGFHFRVFDSMLSGTPVLVRKSQQDNLYGGLGTLFEEGVDYLSVDISNTEQNILNLEESNLNKVALNARNKVLSKHTWFHRLADVVKDINEFS